MYDPFGNEITKMTKEEAETSVHKMGKMMEYFEGICELCGKQRKDCSVDCVERQLSTSFK